VDFWVITLQFWRWKQQALLKYDLHGVITHKSTVLSPLWKPQISIQNEAFIRSLWLSIYYITHKIEQICSHTTAKLSACCASLPYRITRGLHVQDIKPWIEIVMHGSVMSTHACTNLWMERRQVEKQAEKQKNYDDDIILHISAQKYFSFIHSYHSK
jgi:hypothetical protein